MAVHFNLRTVFSESASLKLSSNLYDCLRFQSTSIDFFPSGMYYSQETTVLRNSMCSAEAVPRRELPGW